jgi:hypothetical protein
MRESHLYTGLFLVPWMVVYALSAFFLNHSTWFTETLKLAPQWKVIQETGFRAPPDLSQDAEGQVQAILTDLFVNSPAVRLVG